MFNDFLDQISLDGVKLVTFCPICDEHHKNIDAKILEERGNNYLVYLKCKKCNSSIVSLIANSGAGVNSINMIVDLVEDEVLKFKDFKAINSDDVIAVHQFLNQESGMQKLNR